MARSRYHFLQDDPGPYFLTATTVNWLPLFSSAEIAEILLDSLRFLTASARIRLFAYVVMENHVHLIAEAQDLSKELADFKSFTARSCIDFYMAHHMQVILDQLALHRLDHKVDRKYQFWQEGSHPQRIVDEKMLEQKIEYIHNNPVRRGYVDLPEHWRYSSARDYLGMKGLVPVEVIG